MSNHSWAYVPMCQCVAKKCNGRLVVGCGLWVVGAVLVWDDEGVGWRKGKGREKRKGKTLMAWDLERDQRDHSTGLGREEGGRNEGGREVLVLRAGFGWRGLYCRYYTVVVRSVVWWYSYRLTALRPHRGMNTDRHGYSTHTRHDRTNIDSSLSLCPCLPVGLP